MLLQYYNNIYCALISLRLCFHFIFIVTNLKNDIIRDRKVQMEKIEEGKLLLINNSQKIEQLQNELSECIDSNNQLRASCNTVTAEIEEVSRIQKS